jgi:hypothetical protein
MATGFDETQFLLDSVMAQRAEHAKQLLGSAGLQKTGTKHDLRERLAEALSAGDLTPNHLVEVLDTVEAWGRQHVFLYVAPDKVPVHLKSVTGLQSTLKNIGWTVTVNAPASIIMPSQKEVRLVSLHSDRLRVEWVETRKWTERLPTLDRIESIDGEEIVFQANSKRYQRAISSFEWNFLAQTGELSIHRLPSGTRYDKEEEAFQAILKPLVDLENFEKIRMRKALTKLKDAAGIRERKTNYLAASGSKLSMQSSGRGTTIGAEPDLKEVRDLIKQSKKMGVAFLNCFWEENGTLLQEVHTHIDGFDCRVGFLAQCTKESVTYVLSRIRKAAG